MLAGAYLGEIYLGDISDSSAVSGTPTPTAVAASATIPAPTVTCSANVAVGSAATYFGIAINAAGVNSTPGTGLSELSDLTLSNQGPPSQSSATFWQNSRNTAPSATFTTHNWGSIAATFISAGPLITLNAAGAESGTTTAAATYASISQTFTNNALVVALIEHSRTGGTPSVMTSLTGTSVKNSFKVADVLWLTGATSFRLELWAAQGTGSAGQVTMQFPEVQSCAIWKFNQFDNVATAMGALGLGVDQASTNSGNSGTASASLPTGQISSTALLPAEQVPPGPATVAATALVRAPTVDAPLSVGVTNITATATVPAPTILTTSEPRPTTISTVATVNAPTITAPITPLSVAAVATVQVPVVAISVSPAPSTAARTAAVNSPTVTASANPAPSQIATVASVPVVVIVAGGNASVNVVNIGVTATVPAPSITFSANPTPSAVAATASVPAPAPSTGAGPTPSTIAAIATLAAVTVATSLDATITPSPVAAVATVPAPVISQGETVTAVHPDTVTAFVRVLLPGPLPMTRQVVSATFIGATPKATAQGATRVSESVS